MLTAYMHQNSISVYRGDDFTTQIVFAEDDEYGAPVPIINWQIVLNIKKYKKDILDPSVPPVYTVTVVPDNPLTGIVNVDVSHTVTDQFSGLYYYSFHVVKADGSIQTLVTGGITFVPRA